ncbi:YpmS family protein [Anoxybacteroides tepidamans]|uniref:YpmS family protein n=1 Tax=Anoxybacteroides tepidamans TaxID=265948 RepID=UPI000487BE90|nr:YpmS family protein [Anoxybacillus tepidamans]
MKWKRAFFALLAVNIVMLASLLFLVFRAPKEAIPAPKATKGATFLVYASKEDVNVMINNYIKEKAKNGPLSYHAWIDDRVYLTSKVPIFGRQVDLTVSFIPEVVHGGNLELRDPDLSLGELRLPVNYALAYLQKHANLPEEVVINPDKSRVYIALANIRFKNGYRIAAKQFDLQHDHIVFTLTVPNK